MCNKNLITRVIQIVNVMIQMRKFPKILTVFTVIRIHENGSSFNVSNYRSTSLTKVIEKIAEMY